MKNLGIVWVLVLSVFMSNALELSAQESNKKKKTEDVVFLVSMHCENCKKKIEKNISWEKGVKDLRIDLEKKTVSIRFDPTKTTPEKLQKSIEKLEFTCTLFSADFKAF